MITTLEEKYFLQLKDIMFKEQKLEEKEINNLINKCNKKIIYIEDNIIKGYCFMYIWKNSKEKYEVYLYVRKEYRRHGIGTILYNEIISNINEILFIDIECDSLDNNDLKFYYNLGFKDWYQELDLDCYINKTKKDELDITLINYEDKYFINYANALRTSYYRLRKENDFEPYYCIELTEDKRKEFYNNRENIYLLLDGKEIIGSVCLEGNYIENIFVQEKYQGLGYGKKILLFIINKVFSKYNKVSLDAISWNKKAVNMYLNHGFVLTRTRNFLRKFYKEK